MEGEGDGKERREVGAGKGDIKEREAEDGDFGKRGETKGEGEGERGPHISIDSFEPHLTAKMLSQFWDMWSHMRGVTVLMLQSAPQISNTTAICVCVCVCVCVCSVCVQCVCLHVSSNCTS